MDEPSTDGLYDIVVGDDLRDVGVPMLLFTASSLAAGSAETTPPGRVVSAAAEGAVQLDGLALFSTDAYRLQRALGQQLLDLS